MSFLHPPYVNVAALLAEFKPLELLAEELGYAPNTIRAIRRPGRPIKPRLERDVAWLAYKTLRCPWSLAAEETLAAMTVLRRRNWRQFVANWGFLLNPDSFLGLRISSDTDFPMDWDSLVIIHVLLAAISFSPVETALRDRAQELYEPFTEQLLLTSLLSHDDQRWAMFLRFQATNNRISLLWNQTREQRESGLSAAEYNQSSGVLDQLMALDFFRQLERYAELVNDSDAIRNATGFASFFDLTDEFEMLKRLAMKIHGGNEPEETFYIRDARQDPPYFKSFLSATRGFK